MSFTVLSLTSNTRGSITRNAIRVDALVAWVRSVSTYDFDVRISSFGTVNAVPDRFLAKGTISTKQEQQQQQQHNAITSASHGH